VLHHILVDALMLYIVVHYWKMDFCCIPLVISDQIAQLCPFTSGAVYPPCQKPLVRSCQTFIYNCLSTQNEYPIILQFINCWFTPQMQLLLDLEHVSYSVATAIADVFRKNGIYVGRNLQK
jgi:hypothetical protein